MVEHAIQFERLQQSMNESKDMNEKKTASKRKGEQ